MALPGMSYNSFMSGGSPNDDEALATSKHGHDLALFASENEPPGNRGGAGGQARQFVPIASERRRGALPGTALVSYPGASPMRAIRRLGSLGIAHSMPPLRV